MTAEPTVTLERQPISVEEAMAAYPDQWILMRVTACNEYDAPTHGIVVATDPSRDGIQPAVMEHLLAARASGNRYSVFFGHTSTPEEEWYHRWELLFEAEIAGEQQSE